MEDNQASSLGIKDPTKWLPFVFDMDIVEAAKMSSDEEDDVTYGCTTLYTRGGDVFVIDTQFRTFVKVFEEYKALFDFPNNLNDSPEDGDVDL